MTALGWVRAAFTFAALCWSAHGGPVSHWMETAHTYYQAEQFDSAGYYYQKIIDDGVKNTAVFYNLGNCQYRQGRIGLAITNYERARRLSPTDPDIQHNLRFARANIVDRVPEPQRSFFESVLHGFHVLLPLRTQLWTLSVMLLVLSLMFAAALYVSHNLRLWLIYLGALLIIVMTVIGVSAGVKMYQLETVTEAVVTVMSVDAYNAPKGDKVLFTAHEGTTFRIVQRMDSWVLVSLPNGASGWVESIGMTEI